MRNPIQQIIPDELFSTLLEMNLINLKALRDLEIKREYKMLRYQGLKSLDAICELTNRYPYLQYDTVRKIVYSVRLPEEADAA